MLTIHQAISDTCYSSEHEVELFKQVTKALLTMLVMSCIHNLCIHTQSFTDQWSRKLPMMSYSLLSTSKKAIARANRYLAACPVRAPGVHVLAFVDLNPLDLLMAAQKMVSLDTLTDVTCARSTAH